MKQLNKTFLILLLIDILFIIAHLLFQNYNFLELTAEKNLPTIYQALKTFAVAILLLIILSRKKVKYAVAVAVSFFFLALDDLLSIHEVMSTKVYLFSGIEQRFNWIFLYFPFLVILTIFFVKFYKAVKLNMLAIIGLSLFTLAFMLEISEALNAYSRFSFIERTLEEAVELLGTTFIIGALVERLKPKIS